MIIMEYLKKADGSVLEERADEANVDFCLNRELLIVRPERRSISIVNLCRLTVSGTRLLIR